MTKLRYIKDLIKKNPLARVVIEERKRIRYNYYAKKYSDREFAEKLYLKFVGRRPDLDNPKAFTEKLQWLKLNYRDPDIPLATDKYEAKRYIERRGFPELLIPTLAVWDSAREMDFDALPDEFILKATHGSGWNYICRGKSGADENRQKKIFAAWLRQDLYNLGREWNYKDLTPRIIAEPLMDDKPLVDYKFMCFNGRCRAMQVNSDRDGRHYVDFYDGDWNLIPDMCCTNGDNSGTAIEKPADFERMKEIAEKLAEPFPFVRVDLYDINGRIYFGEMTFFPGSGFWKITPEKYDYMFGEWLDIEDLKNEQSE